eukprot:CAMPEP_0185812280 /NCGR_PEP_ID=MMETSP1322-20130828/9115_1 /TAXON_ID=265543 /ORGANISM="Minutocellus polymorphus, Strain RCC2270" /LENGTH=76 /DNA_ID=CAMNT_0028508801 /DNA_START=73 /DNA_END=299 /DNA_ORIENTATION=+
MPSSGKGRGNNGNKIAEKFRDACPEHKRKDLDALVKSLKGDEGAIQAAIVEWWNEPQQVEPEWEVKEKKPKKAAPA